MKKFNDSPYQMLKYVFPKYFYYVCFVCIFLLTFTYLLFSYQWKPWLFSQVEKNYWNSHQNIRDYRLYFDEIVSTHSVPVENLLSNPLLFVFNSAPHLKKQ